MSEEFEEIRRALLRTQAALLKLEERLEKLERYVYPKVRKRA